MSNIGTRISTLWIVVMFTMVYADILSFLTPGELQKLWDGSAGVTLTPGLLLVFAILLEIPVVMIYLSRVLKPTANRWANTVAVAVTIVYVIGGGSFNLPHYIFFAAVEIGCMVFIVWSLWARRSAEAVAAQPVG
jgi:Sec-independent protein secretion pathway component TatC